MIRKRIVSLDFMCLEHIYALFFDWQTKPERGVRNGMFACACKACICVYEYHNGCSNQFLSGLMSWGTPYPLICSGNFYYTGKLSKLASVAGRALNTMMSYNNTFATSLERDPLRVLILFDSRFYQLQHKLYCNVFLQFINLLSRLCCHFYHISHVTYYVSPIKLSAFQFFFYNTDDELYS
jgi:hypothetical protein